MILACSTVHTVSISRWALIEILPNIVLLPQIGVLYDKFHVLFCYLCNFHRRIVCIGHDRILFMVRFLSTSILPDGRQHRQHTQGLGLGRARADQCSRSIEREPGAKVYIISKAWRRKRTLEWIILARHSIGMYKLFSKGQTAPYLKQVADWYGV